MHTTSRGSAPVTPEPRVVRNVQVEQSARPPPPVGGGYRPALTVYAINSLNARRDVESDQIGEPDQRSESGSPAAPP